MCGICGKLFFDRSRVVTDELLHTMTEVMCHRGPDDEGYYVKGQIGIGHRRLSIIDLATGKQPISNEDDSAWIVFNGEIYNYQLLRAPLVTKGHRFKTNTDTEVILHLYEQYGPQCVDYLRGMFAFAIWNEKKRELLLARDRVGIKPLYYRIDDRCLLFGSEMKAILRDPSVPREVDVPMIDRFLSYYYMPGDETLLKGIKKLTPGHYLVARDGRVEIKQYWDLHFGRVTQDLRNFSEAKEALRHLLRETSRLHMISDVPVGFLLSGGVDSTAMLSLSVAETSEAVSSFTVGFEGQRFDDERPYARLAADRFGSKHYEYSFTSREFADFLPKYVWHMEEPVCEPPAISLYYISKLASEHVKVLISGEGGDEAFAGYQNYRNLVWLDRIKRLVGPLDGPISYTLEKLSGINGVTGRIRKYAQLLPLGFGDYYYSRTSSPFNLFNNRYSEFYSSDFLKVVDKDVSIEPTRRHLKKADSYDNLAKMLYTDTKSWLPDDLLVKADKITMANSVELRVPLLDHKVLEFASGLPANYKIHGTKTKRILKDILTESVPAAILNRRKTGFPVPYENWLRTDLKDLVRETVMAHDSALTSYFTRTGLEKCLALWQQGEDYSKEIFSLVILDLWHRTYL